MVLYGVARTLAAISRPNGRQRVASSRHASQRHDRCSAADMLIRKLCKRDVVTIAPTASVLEAARLMRAEHVGDVVVIGRDRQPIGILTDRDIVVGIVAQDVEHLTTLTVQDVLTPEPIVALEDEDAEAALGRMRRSGVRRLPVVDLHGAVVGIFSVDDFLDLLAEELRAVVSLVTKQPRHEQSRRP